MAAISVLALGLSACGTSKRPTSTATTRTVAPATTPTTATTTTTTGTATTARPKRSKTRTQTATNPTPSTPTPAPMPTTTRTIPATGGPTTPPPPTPTYTPPMRVTLVGQDHAPVVNQPWKYTVTVTDANGRPLSGTETTHYTFNGSIVGTEKPTDVRFTNGVYHDTIEFPPASLGYPLAVQITVHTVLGTATRSWTIKVKKA